VKWISYLKVTFLRTRRRRRRRRWFRPNPHPLQKWICTSEHLLWRVMYHAPMLWTLSLIVPPAAAVTWTLQISIELIRRQAVGRTNLALQINYHTGATSYTAVYLDRRNKWPQRQLVLTLVQKYGQFVPSSHLHPHITLFILWLFNDVSSYPVESDVKLINYE
jgi:hypothetical protein